VNAPQTSWVVTLVLEDDLLTLNRAMGIIRRRNLPVGNVAFGLTSRPGTLRLTCIVTSDRAAAERMANAMGKMAAVREVAVYPEAECTLREHALVRVRVPSAGLSALLDAVSLFQATIVEERPEEILLEATGASPFMLSFLRALEPFGIIDVARGATLALPPQAVAEGSGVPRAISVSPRLPTAVPA